VLAFNLIIMAFTTVRYTDPPLKVLLLQNCLAEYARLLQTLSRFILAFSTHIDPRVTAISQTQTFFNAFHVI
jgi:hypothetical protein